MAPPLLVVRNQFADLWAKAITLRGNAATLSVSVTNGEGYGTSLVREDENRYRLEVRLNPGERPSLQWRHSRRWLAAFDEIRHDIGEIALIHEHFSNNAWAARLLARHRGVPYVVTEHSSTYSGRNPDRFLSVTTRHIVRRNLSLASGVVVVTRSLESDLRRLKIIGSRVPVAVINNPVQPWFEPGAHRRQSDSLRLITVARLAPEKNVTAVVEAVSSLRKRGRDVSAVLIGDGPMRPQVEGLVRDLDLTQFVTIVGSVENRDLVAYLREADIFVLPSLWENDPVALREALSLGLPVVATAVGGVPSIVSVDDGKIVRPSDTSELVDAISDVGDRLDQFDRMAIAGRAASVSSLSAVGARVWDFYRKLNLVE